MANGLFGGGDGTSNSPYLVEDFADINAIKNHVVTPNVHFLQVNHIDFEGYDTWNPIGDNGVGPFMGKYDGGNYNINGIVSAARGDDQPTGGLFGFTYGGSIISNVNLKDATVTGANNVGGIVGMNQGPIYNCTFTGSIEGKSYVGGITGLMQYDVTNCSVRGSITAETTVGGIAGNTSPTDGANDVTDSYCLADITATASEGLVAGGIIGFATQSDAINTYFNGNLSAPNTFALSDVGGILGQVDESIAIDSYYNYEKVIASNSQGTGVSTSDLAIASTFNGWDFDSTWLMDGDSPVIVGQPNFGAPIFAEGNGTEENPYQVTTAEELQGISRMLSSVYYFKQMNDIDMTDFGLFAPIGNGSAAFLGVFDGSDFEITNLTIEREADYNGLFGHSKGTVKNTHIKGQINAGGYAGGIVGMNYGTIADCSFEGAINAGEYVGGICGMQFGIVERCFSSGTFQATNTIGGIAGMQSNDGTRTEDSYSTADVKIVPISGAFSVTIAGLIGGFYSGDIRRCFAIGKVDITEVPESVRSLTVGALTGPTYGSQIIEDSFYDLEVYGGTSPTGTGKITMQFAQQETFTKYDFENIWAMGDEHPILYFQVIPPEPEPPEEPIVYDFTQNELLRDRFNGIVPQVWDAEKGQFVPITADMLAPKITAPSGPQVIYSENLPTAEDGVEGDLWIRQIKEEN